MHRVAMTPPADDGRPGPGWGIGLLRDSDVAEEQAARFADGRQYSGMPMTHYALIDFRQSRSSLPLTKPNFHHVIFPDAGFARAELKSAAGSEPIELSK